MIKWNNDFVVLCSTRIDTLHLLLDSADELLDEDGDFDDEYFEEEAEPSVGSGFNNTPFSECHVKVSCSMLKDGYIHVVWVFFTVLDLFRFHLWQSSFVEEKYHILCGS